MRSLYSILVFLLLLSSCKQTKKEEVLAIANPEVSLEDPFNGSNLIERMNHYKVPGISITVVDDGKIVWSKGYGVANTTSGVAVDENTLFQAGSISKPVAALAVLKLLEEGKVDLNADVNQYLKDWHIPENEFTETEKVTLEGLLTHTAGITVHGFPGYRQTESFPSIISVLNGKGNTAKIEVDKSPGESWRYSGGGYTIAEKVVEDVSGLPLEEYMDKNILKPLGMTNSTYEQPLSKKHHTQASAAYNRRGKIVKGLWHNYPEQAAAGLWTTPTDLAKYCIEVQEILAGEKEGLLSRNTLKLMLTKHQNNWGLGPVLSKEGDSLRFGHGGKNKGFTNHLLATAHQGKALIIMINADNGRDLIKEIQDVIFDYYHWQ